MMKGNWASLFYNLSFYDVYVNQGEDHSLKEITSQTD